MPTWEQFDQGEIVINSPQGQTQAPTTGPAGPPVAAANPNLYPTQSNGDYTVDQARQQINAAYLKYLGRPASQGELADQLRGQGWQYGDRYVGSVGLNSVLRSIQNSEEAKTYATRAAQPQAGTPADYSQWGSNRPEGLDNSKVDRGHDSPKYQIARVLSHFDPNKGITPEVIAALNQLNIGEFYSDDPEQLGVRNATDPRFEDFLFDNDIVKNFTNDGNSSAAWLGWGGDGPDPGMDGGPHDGTFGGGGGSFAGIGGGGGGAPGYEDFRFDEQFTAPTEADMGQDPGYQFRLTEGQRALERSAAARGVLRTGGTLKGVADWSQGLASQEYGQVYGRRASEYDRRFGNALATHSTNQGNRLGFGNLGLGYYQAGNQYDLGLKNIGLGYHTANQANALGWAGHGLNVSNSNFNNGFALSQLGFNATNAAAMYGSQYANNAGNIYGQQGNANAAGQVGGANAYSGALSNIGRDAMNAAYYYNQRR